MDWPIVWADNSQQLEPSMVFFLPMILIDDSSGYTVSLGETSIVADGACEPANHAPRELVIN